MSDVNIVEEMKKHVAKVNKGLVSGPGGWGGVYTWEIAATIFRHLNNYDCAIAIVVKKGGLDQVIQAFVDLYGTRLGYDAPTEWMNPEILKEYHRLVEEELVGQCRSMNKGKAS